jgi:hypothetical protein
MSDLLPALLLAIAFLAAPARAADTLEGIDFKELRARAASVAAPTASAPEAPAPQAAAPVPAGSVDMSPFLRRLEDSGLKSDGVRALLSRITVVFGEPSASANAQWKFLRKILVIPVSFKEPHGSAIRYDLAPNEISTVIHEMTHAENGVIASQAAPRGSVAFEHYDALYSIWGDLRSTAYFYRYGGFKADEVSGYFMGAAVSEVFEAITEIATFNTARPAPTGADTGPQGDALVLPSPESARDAWEKSLAEKARRPFGAVSVSETAMFEGSLVGWEERSTTKTQMYRNLLGLNPPKDRAELLKRLNASDSEWIRALRRKTLENRRRAARPRP